MNYTEIEDTTLIRREITRDNVATNRRLRRHDESDGRRLQIASVGPERIKEIISKLKSKAVTKHDLSFLKNSIIDDPANIFKLMSTGELRGLVRELTGSNPDKRLEACSCICNLALEQNDEVCFVITKAVGVYLTTALQSFHNELINTCAWTLGNLADGGVKSCERILELGSVPILCSLLKSGPDNREAATYALLQISRQMEDSLSVAYLNQMLDSIQHDTDVDTARLLFILSCHNDFMKYEHLENKIIKNILNEQLPKSLSSHLNSCTKDNIICCNLIFLLRILANVDLDLITNIFPNFCSCNIVTDLKKIINSKNIILQESLMWFLGNMYNYNNDMFSQKFMS